MKKLVQFSMPSDKELIVNFCLCLLPMIRKCNNDDYRLYLRKAYVNLNALIEIMQIDETDFVQS